MLWLIFIIAVIILCIKLLRNHLNYFKDQNVPYFKSTPLLGMFDDFILGRKNLFEIDLDIYNHPQLKDEPFFGVFDFHKPAIVLKDLELIKKVLSKDAYFFINRTMTTDEKDPLNFNLG